MLGALFKKRKVMQDKKEVTLPAWARNSEWLCVAEELVKYASPWEGSACDFSKLCLKNFGFSKKEMRAVAIFGLQFLHALHIESEKRKEVELVHEKLTVTSECLEVIVDKTKEVDMSAVTSQTSADRPECLGEQCAALMDKCHDAQTLDKGCKPSRKRRKCITGTFNEKTERLISSGGVELATRRISRRHMWFGLLKYGIPRREIDGVPTSAMFNKWKQVVGNCNFRHIKCFSCHKLGHIAKMCHDVKKNGGQQAFASGVPHITARRDLQVYSLRWKSRPFRKNVTRQHWAPYKSFAGGAGEIEKCIL